MRVSVVIPTYNAGAQISDLLASLRAQRPAPDEIIAIDSGSSDDTVARAAAGGARCIHYKERFNHGLTRDAGIQAATGEIVILTVQDAVFPAPDWIAGVCAHFADARVAGVSTRQVPPSDGPLELKIKAELEAQGTPERVELTQHPEYADYSAAQRLELCRFDNVCAALRRSVWQQIPFGACQYGEDLLWSRRALERGFVLVRDPRFPVVHAHRRGFNYEFRRALLDAEFLDEQFGFRYSLVKKAGRARALLASRSQTPLRDRAAAARTYFAHAAARAIYSGYRIVCKPLGVGSGVLQRWTRGI